MSQSAIATPVETSSVAGQLQQIIKKLDQQLPQPKCHQNCPESHLTPQQFDKLITSW